MQIVAPGVPGVSARSRIELKLDALGIEEFQRGETVLIGDILRITLGEDQLAHILLDTIGSLGEALVVTLELLSLGREPACTEHPEVVELIVVVQDGFHRLHTTHRESSHRTMSLVGQYTVVSFDKWDDAGHKILLKEGNLVHEILRSDGAVRHHDNHRLHLSFSQQVVEDGTGTAHTRP